MEIVAWLIDTVYWFLGNINFQCYLISYCIGGIPFGLVLMKICFGIDLRKVGSGSIGATNVLRALQEKHIKHAKTFAILTAALDASKGAVAILIARFIGIEIETQWAMAVLAVLGHCYSPFLNFEGGKGIATGVGVMIVLLPIEALLGLVAWFVIGKLSHISSLASIAGLAGFLISNAFLHPNIPDIQSHAPIVIIAIIIIWKHLPNILRLIRGEEKKVL